MKKLIIFSSVLLVAIIFIAVKYFAELTGNSNSNTKVLKYIPSDATLVVNFSNDESFYDIVEDYELFAEIIGERRSAEISQLKSVLLNDPLVAEISSGEKVFISFHQLKADSLDYLFAMGTGSSVKKDDAELTLKNIEGVKCTPIGESSVFKLELSTLKRPFFIHIGKGVVIGSFSLDLLTLALNEKNDKLPDDFIELINKEADKNQNSPVNLFVNSGNLSPFVMSFMKGRANGNMQLLKGLKGYGALGMNFKSDALMFNGNSTPDTSSSNYLNTFLKQRPVQNQLKAILPQNTANFLTFGVSDFKTFHADLRNYFGKKKELPRLQAQVKAIMTERSLNIDHDLIPKLGNEFLVFETAEGEKLALLKLNNGPALDASLQQLSSKASEFIRRFNYSNVFYYCYGDPMRPFVKPYFQIFDNMLVLANSQGAITRYMDSYKASRFLNKIKDFKEHDQLVATSSNISFFAENKNSSRQIRSSLKNRYAALFKDEESGLSNFYGLSVQWSSASKHFQTNVFANYNTLAKRDFKKEWSYKMNARIASAPQVFRSGDQHIIMVQDNVYNLYAISDEGKRIWATQLPGTIRGKLYQLKDETILFNTEDRIYRIHPDGSAVSGFPVSIPQKTVHGLTLTGNDPAKAKIYIAAQNKILGYTAEGKALENWDKNLPSRIFTELLHTEAGETPYIIAGTRTGEFFFFDERDGSLLHQVAEKNVVTDFRSGLFPVIKERTEDSWVVTTDTAGVLHEISFTDSVSRTSIGVWDENHVFGYKNITGDSYPEYIYLDSKGLSVFNRDNTSVFSYEFEDSVKRNLQFFSTDKSSWSIAVSSYQNNEIYLFDNEGNVSRGFPIKAVGEFYMGVIRNDGLRYLICGSTDGNLHAYKL